MCRICKHKNTKQPPPKKTQTNKKNRWKDSITLNILNPQTEI